MTHTAKYDASYWDKFYSQNVCSSPSQFGALVASELDGICNVADVGCGNGRDSLFFASLGHRVVGLDSSHVVVQSNTQNLMLSGLTNLAFSVCSVGSDKIDEGLKQNRHIFSGEMDFVVFCRFVIHAIPEKCEKNFIEELIQMRSVKKVYFEYRCGGDVNEYKHFSGAHFRRSVEADHVANSMMRDGIFGKEYEYIGRGVAKYRSEDAYVCRQFFVRERV